MRARIWEHAGDRLGARVTLRGLRVHMIGIGGCGMSAAASLLLDSGALVTGSDLTSFDGLGDLVSKGARVTIDHDAANLNSNAELVVVSAAIPDTNPELAAARKKGLPVLKYAQLLGKLMEGRQGVAIAGTHGKSTTSAMCALLFQDAGLEPSFVIGAPTEQLGGASSAGGGPHFIVEACEFDRSFLQLRPKSAAILNIETDHVDCFPSFDQLVSAFTRFAKNVVPDGLIVCNSEDRWAVEAGSRAGAAMETFGFEPGATWRAVNLKSDRGLYRFDVLNHDRRFLTTRLAIPGRYNVANALAAVALAAHADIDPDSIARSLASFKGVTRRLSWRGEGRGVMIVDDYAHHPTEIRVTLEAARYRYSPKRMWVIFQPHQCLRTRYLMEEFAASFGLADEVIVPNVYGARESDAGAERARSEELVSRIHENGGRATYLSDLGAIADHLHRNVTEGDMVLTMGAGDVWKVADELVDRLC